MTNGASDQSDRIEAIPAQVAQSQTDQRFNNLLAEAKADCQTKSRERREFRTFMRQMAEKIRCIWQRLAS
ncbi:MAG TPA: hypothetical protein V6D07_13195 [Trichocoleus sp.]